MAGAALAMIGKGKKGSQHLRQTLADGSTIHVFVARFFDRAPPVVRSWVEVPDGKPQPTVMMRDVKFIVYDPTPGEVAFWLVDKNGIGDVPLPVRPPRRLYDVHSWTGTDYPLTLVWGGYYEDAENWDIRYSLFIDDGEVLTSATPILAAGVVGAPGSETLLVVIGSIEAEQWALYRASLATTPSQTRATLENPQLFNNPDRSGRTGRVFFSPTCERFCFFIDPDSDTAPPPGRTLFKNGRYYEFETTSLEVVSSSIGSAPNDSSFLTKRLDSNGTSPYNAEVDYAVDISCNVVLWAYYKKTEAGYNLYLVHQTIEIYSTTSIRCVNTGYDMGLVSDTYQYRLTRGGTVEAIVSAVSSCAGKTNTLLANRLEITANRVLPLIVTSDNGYCLLKLPEFTRTGPFSVWVDFADLLTPNVYSYGGTAVSMTLETTTTPLDTVNTERLTNESRLAWTTVGTPCRLHEAATTTFQGSSNNIYPDTNFFAVYSAPSVNSTTVANMAHSAMIDAARKSATVNFDLHMPNGLAYAHVAPYAYRENSDDGTVVVDGQSYRVASTDNLLAVVPMNRRVSYEA